MAFLKERNPLSHKGENGRVLVIGGSENYVGAPALAAMAALRSGIDICVIAAPEKAAWAINSYSPDLITKKINGDFFNWDNVNEIVKLAETFDSVLIGNGLGAEPGTMDFVRETIERISVPVVIDADAIKALAGKKISNAIITPHSKEFEIWTGESLPNELSDKSRVVQMFAKNKSVILLKGPVDIIASEDETKFNKTGNPGMTIGGTGDILAGITAGFLAQTKDFFNSAYYAAYLNGRIGDYLLKKKGIGFTASDMVELIPIFRRKI